MSTPDDRQRPSTFDELAQTLVTDDANLADALQQVAEVGCRVLTSCAARA